MALTTSADDEGLGSVCLGQEIITVVIVAYTIVDHPLESSKDMLHRWLSIDFVGFFSTD